MQFVQNQAVFSILSLCYVDSHWELSPLLSRSGFSPTVPHKRTPTKKIKHTNINKWGAFRLANFVF